MLFFLTLRRRRFTAELWRRNLSSSTAVYSGHNKWSKIKGKKAILDQKKGAINSKASRDIMVAIRTGGSSDPELNKLLHTALQKAKTAGVPKDNIRNAITKATTGNNGSQAVTYEAMAPGNTGIIIECLTDNVKRTLADMRHTLDEHSARFAPVGFLFNRRGLVKMSMANEGEVDEVVEAALEAGAEDFEQLDPSEDGNDAVELEFTCPPSGLNQLTTAVSEYKHCKEVLMSELMYAPVEASEPPEEVAVRAFDLVDELEDHQDVLRVWTTLGSRD